MAGNLLVGWKYEGERGRSREVTNGVEDVEQEVRPSVTGKVSLPLAGGGRFHNYSEGADKEASCR